MRFIDALVAVPGILLALTVAAVLGAGLYTAMIAVGIAWIPGFARIVRSLRQLELKKPPSVSETLDWARTLVLLGVEHVDAEQASATANVLLKYQSDIAKAGDGHTWKRTGPAPR